MINGSVVLLFKRILDFKQAALNRLRNKRKGDRYRVGPGFPLKGTVSLRGGAATACDWSGAAANLSTHGASLLLPSAAATTRGERTSLRLTIDQYAFQLPCAVAHFRVLPTHAVCGLTLEPSGFPEQKAYFQLLEAVRIGAAMAPVKAPAFARCPPGLSLEQFRADSKSRLNVWHQTDGREIDSFELVIDQHCLRGEAASQKLEISTRAPAKPGKAAPADNLSAGVTDEVRQLFRWVVLNFTSAVPADVQGFMRDKIQGTRKPAERGVARPSPVAAPFPPPVPRRPATRPPLSLK